MALIFVLGVSTGDGLRLLVGVPGAELAGDDIVGNIVEDVVVRLVWNCGRYDEGTRLENAPRETLRVG